MDDTFETVHLLWDDVKYVQVTLKKSERDNKPRRWLQSSTALSLD